MYLNVIQWWNKIIHHEWVSLELDDLKIYRSNIPEYFDDENRLETDLLVHHFAGRTRFHILRLLLFLKTLYFSFQNTVFKPEDQKLVLLSVTENIRLSANNFQTPARRVHLSLTYYYVRAQTTNMYTYLIIGASNYRRIFSDPCTPPIIGHSLYYLLKFIILSFLDFSL